MENADNWSLWITGAIALEHLCSHAVYGPIYNSEICLSNY